MTPREPSEAAVLKALDAWHETTTWRDFPDSLRGILRTSMRAALRAAYVVDATQGRDG